MSSDPVSSLEIETIALARSYVGVRELRKNSGPEIDRWLEFCGCEPGAAYCSCFVSWCVLKAAATTFPKFRKSSGAMRLLVRNADLVVTADEARELMGAGHPLVFVLDMGEGRGHAGFALGLLEHEDDYLVSIEANTGPGPAVPVKDREGDGVHLRSDRRVDSVDGGWLRIA